MTENEAKDFVQGKLDCMNKCDVFDCKGTDECDNCQYCYSQGNFGEQKKAFETAIQALEEIQQYRAIGKVEEVKYLVDSYNGMMHDFGDDMRALEQYRAIGTVDEVKIMKDFKELYDAYNLIGTIEEFKNLKYKKNVIPIATIEFSKEDMQKIVDEKVAQIELDIQEIRAMAIDEFVKLADECSGYTANCIEHDLALTIYTIHQIAEQMKVGGK